MKNLWYFLQYILRIDLCSEHLSEFRAQKCIICPFSRYDGSITKCEIDGQYLFTKNRLLQQRCPKNRWKRNTQSDNYVIGDQETENNGGY